MQFSLALLSLVGAAAAQGVTQRIAPPTPNPAGCTPTYNGQFQIAVIKPSGAGAKEKRQNGLLLLNLRDGVLKEQTKGATGYIADNYQFQFDAPPQTGAIYTAGFAACPNNTLALGGSTTFYQCLSGGFYNLYDRHWAAQCSPINLEIIPYGGSTGAPKVTSTVASGPVGTVPVTTATKSLATQLPDGQPGASSKAPLVSSIVKVSQISDGQPQAPTFTPPVISQISDGQPQAPTGPLRNATYTAPVPRYTGAADKNVAGSFLAVAMGAVAAALL